MPRKKPQIFPNPTAFSLNGKKPQAYVKREVSTRSQINGIEDTLIYGEDDALPLRIAKLTNESPAATACLNTISKYIKGSRFSNEDLMKLKIDKNGTTLWGLHTMLCNMLSQFQGFAVNFKFDAGGGITNTYVLSFESVRLMKPDDEGYITKVKYNPYFGTQEFKKEYTTCYHLYNKETILNQMQDEGNAFTGQVYYFGKTTPIYRFYPVPDYWSAKNWIQVDAKIQEFHNENLENGFFQSVLMNVIGDPSAPSQNPKYQQSVTGTDSVKRGKSSKTVGEEFNEMMSEAFSGSRKAGTALALWSQTHDTAVKIQPFQTNTNADLFTALQDLTTKNITIATQVPGILANISEGVNLGSGGSEIQKAVELMQSRVAEEQQLLEQFYNEVLLPNLSSPITEQVKIVNFNPVSVPVDINDKLWEQFSSKEKRQFTKQTVSNFSFDEETEEEAPSKRTLIEVIGVGGSQALMSILQQYAEDKLSETQAINILQILFGVPFEDAKRMVQKEPVLPGVLDAPKPEEPKVNDNLRNLTGRQLQGIQRIVRKFNKGELTLEQAKQLLVSGFAFSEQDVNDWLITPEEE